MIFYTLIRLWQLLISVLKYLVWFQPSTPVTEGILEARIDKVVETGKVLRIRCLATYWTGRSRKEINLTVGDYIKVVGRTGLTLWIEPLERQKCHKQSPIQAE